MKKPKQYDKRFLPMLWIGLGLWILSIVVTYILEETGNAPSGQTNLMSMGKMMFQRIPLFILLLLCVVQPVFEEFAFRLWTVGKKWTTAVCLVLMAFFVLSEMKLWGLLPLAAFVVVLICVKNRYTQLWLNSFISSLAFALCHVSGFGEFGWGMVFGLLDIFGMALVLCWLAININFWMAPLLHVLNNSLAILLPFFLLPDPVSSEVKSTVDGEVKEGFKTVIEPLHAFRNNDALIEGSADLSMLSVDATEFYLVGEPAQIAMKLAQKADSEAMYYYDWVSRNESMEERVVYRVSDRVGPAFDYAQLRDCYLEDIATFMDDTIVADTVEAMLKEIWLVYDDGHEELLTEQSADRWEAQEQVLNSGKTLLTEYSATSDTTVELHYYAVEKTWGENSSLSDAFKLSYLAKMTHFHLEYRDAHKTPYIIFR